MSPRRSDQTQESFSTGGGTRKQRQLCFNTKERSGRSSFTMCPRSSLPENCTCPRLCSPGADPEMRDLLRNCSRERPVREWGEQVGQRGAYGAECAAVGSYSLTHRDSGGSPIPQSHRDLSQRTTNQPLVSGCPGGM